MFILQRTSQTNWLNLQKGIWFSWVFAWGPNTKFHHLQPFFFKTRNTNHSFMHCIFQVKKTNKLEFADQLIRKKTKNKKIVIITKWEITANTKIKTSAIKIFDFCLIELEGCSLGTVAKSNTITAYVYYLQSGR